MADLLINQFIDRLDEINVKNEHYGQMVESIEYSENRLLADCWNLGELFTDLKSQLAELCSYAMGEVRARGKKIDNIRKILSNKDIQIVFIGSVSSGKSKVINAIIEEEIFQSSTGATTTHIVKLTESGDNRSYLIHGSSERVYYDKRDDLIEKILELSTTLGDQPIGDNDSLEVYLSEPKGRILDSRIVLIDTPGCDSTVKAKFRILEMCQTADIVVFVMTYNFNEAERAMFENLSKKTSKLNIYILVNKWDESDTDKADSTEKSKKTIENNLFKWLTKSYELNEDSARSKYFFISAKELMETVKNEAKDATSADHEQNAKLRHEQFEKFIHELKGSIDDPEYTKCRKHEKDIDNIEVKLDGDIQQCLKMTKEMMDRRKESVDTIKLLQQNLEVNKTRLLKTLSLEKIKRLELLKNLEIKQSGWLHGTSNCSKQNVPNEEDLLKLDELVSRFDDELNKIENIDEDNLKQICSYAISKESSEMGVKIYKTILTDEKDSKQSQLPEQNESTIPAQMEGNKNKGSKHPNDNHEKKKKKEENESTSLDNCERNVTVNVLEKEEGNKNKGSKQRNNNSQKEKKKEENESTSLGNCEGNVTVNVLEKEMINTFQAFDATISKRLETIFETMERFRKYIKLSNYELQSIHAKKLTQMFNLC